MHTHTYKANKMQYNISTTSTNSNFDIFAVQALHCGMHLAFVLSQIE